jgi:hypothetical protein
MNFGTSMMLLLSATALILAVGLLDTNYKIWRRWKKSDQEEKNELEKSFYLVFAATAILLAIRLFMVPLYFFTLQSFIPLIPGAMCLWGVFNALPGFLWPALVLNLVLPLLYAGWLVLAHLNAQCRRNQLVGNLSGFFILLSPLLLIDSILDLTIFIKITPIEVTCCSNAIDIGPNAQALRAFPPPIGALNGQQIMLMLFVLVSSVFIAFAFLSIERPSFEWPARLLTVIMTPMTIITMAEVFTPWILNSPFHYCPFCLVARSPPSLVFILLYWLAISATWWTMITEKLGREDDESENLEKATRTKLWKIAAVSNLLGLIIMIVATTVSFG